jgi:hypothetical protein
MFVDMPADTNKAGSGGAGASTGPGRPPRGTAGTSSPTHAGGSGDAPSDTASETHESSGCEVSRGTSSGLDALLLLLPAAVMLGRRKRRLPT